MKICFMFETSADCNEVAKYLSASMSAKVEVQALDNKYTIFVQDEDYNDAVTLGINYLTENQIRSSWVNSWGHETPMNLVPFAYIQLDEEIRFSPCGLSTTALVRLSKFGETCENLFNKKVFVKLFPSGNVTFLLEQPISINHHSDIVNLVNEQIPTLVDEGFRKIFLTDIFGKPIITYKVNY